MSLSGYAVCLNCPVRDQLMPRAQFESTPLEKPITAAALTAVSIIKSPRSFFAAVAPTREWFRPFIFGYVCVLIGTSFSTLWQSLFVSQFSATLADVTTQMGISEGAMRALLVASLPPGALFLIIVHALLLFTALRTIGQTNAGFSNVMRIVGFASAAHLFQIIPPVWDVPLGHFLAIIWLFNIELIAVQRYFELTLGRSLAVVFIPYLFTALFSA